MSPRKGSRAASSASGVTSTGWVSSTVPVVSWVSVTWPRRRPARYSFSPSLANSTARVARPTNTGSTPVAMGSRVPAWPMRRSPSTRRSFAHTSILVQSWGLSMIKIPLGTETPPFLAAKPSAAGLPRRGGAGRRDKRNRASGSAFHKVEPRRGPVLGLVDDKDSVCHKTSRLLALPALYRPDGLHQDLLGVGDVPLHRGPGGGGVAAAPQKGADRAGV